MAAEGGVSATRVSAIRSKKKVLPRFILNDSECEIFCVKFSPDDTLLAASFSTGEIKIYNTATGKLVYTICHNDSPVTAFVSSSFLIVRIRWRPHTDAVKTKNVLVSVNTDGQICHWHVMSGKLLSEIILPNEQLFCIDFNADGTRFAVGGKSRAVHVFDEASKTVVARLSSGEFNTKPGHANRVFAVRFHTVDPNLICSAGWDNTIQVWDIRSQSSIRHMFGPFICGEALDISADGKTVLSGSWKSDNQLQLWDFETGALLKTIPWRAANSDGDACMVYTAQFSKNALSDCIVAGGSGANEAKVFDLSIPGHIASFGTITSMSKGCFTSDFSHDSTMLAVAGADGAIRLLTVQMSD